MDRTITIDATPDNKDEISEVTDLEALVTLSADFDLFASYLVRTPKIGRLGLDMASKQLSVSGDDQNKAIKAGFVLLQSL